MSDTKQSCEDIVWVYLVEQQNEVQGKCKEQSQKTQVVEVS